VAPLSPLPEAGYDANSRPFAIAGAEVSGSPSHHAHFVSPVFASSANVVHYSVLNAHTLPSHTGADGPSSDSARPH
jgi:hypothetical protein